MDSCNIVLQFRQMEKYILMKQSLSVYFLHHLPSYGIHVLLSNDMHLGENTPVKSVSNVGIHITEPHIIGPHHSCELQLTLIQRSGQ